MIPDDYRKSLKIEVIIGCCEHCGGEIYLGDVFWRTKYGKVHEDCFDDFVEGVLEAELIEGFEGAKL